ncbi:spermidine/putrescine ABC transporter substrate-binding protein, partial [Streptomyces sp. SID8380]|nr:spermidine/putrescine ABC transporter substrate-binding protein [Streptomyces sp. SID8380]
MPKPSIPRSLPVDFAATSRTSRAACTPRTTRARRDIFPPRRDVLP